MFMQHLIEGWLIQAGLTQYTYTVALLIVIAFIILTAVVIHFVLHRGLLPMLRRHANASSRQWPKALLDSYLFDRFV